MRRLVSSILPVMTLVACGGSSSPPPAAPTPEPAAPEVAPAPAAEVTEAEAPAETTPAPSAEAPVEAPPAEAKASGEQSIKLIKTTSAGRPMVQYVESTGITTTLGHNGGILKLGDATLRIPDGALREGLNVTFALAPKVKGPAKAIGSVYKVAPDVHTAGPRFQIVLPVPAGKGAVGFAVELSKVDEKTRKPTTAWETVTPTKIFTDSEPNLALLEVDGLFEGHVTLTEMDTPKPQ